MLITAEEANAARARAAIARCEAKEQRRWKVDVNKDFAFEPKLVRVVGRERGMIRYINDSGSEWMWYSNQFFDDYDDCLFECFLLELEASGVVTGRKEAERAAYNHLKEPGKIWRILP